MIENDSITNIAETQPSQLVPALDRQKQIAALVLAQGGTRQQAADEADVGVATIYRWQYLPEFVLEVNRLTYLVCYSEKAERLRFAFQAIRQFVQEDGTIKTGRTSPLDWLRYIREELGSIDLDHLIMLLSNGQLAPPVVTTIPTEEAT